jgi:hypothetical protein
MPPAKRRGGGGRADAGDPAQDPAPVAARAPGQPPRNYEIEFFEENGRKPVLEWIQNDLTPTKRRALGRAMQRVLQVHGVGVCEGAWGKKVDTEGIYEFRLRMSGKEVINLEAEIRGISEQQARERLGADASSQILLRVFFHPHGDKLILLLGGYDKGDDPSSKRQQSEIATATKRLRAYRQQQKIRLKRGPAGDG